MPMARSLSLVEDCPQHVRMAFAALICVININITILLNDKEQTFSNHLPVFTALYKSCVLLQTFQTTLGWTPGSGFCSAIRCLRASEKSYDARAFGCDGNSGGYPQVRVSMHILHLILIYYY